MQTKVNRNGEVSVLRFFVIDGLSRNENPGSTRTYGNFFEQALLGPLSI
jgi:hypothetical protein